MYLERQVKKWRNTKRIATVSALAFTILMQLTSKTNPIFSLTQATAALIIALTAQKVITPKIKIYEVGLRGEKKLYETLIRIPKAKILTNYRPKDGKNGDIDAIIIHPNGIYVIEAKNLSGEVYYNGNKWKRMKTSKNGRKYRGRISSPSKQAIKNAERIKRIIKQKKAKVTPILVFTSERVKLRGKNPKLPILPLNELENYIESNTPQRKLTKKQINKIFKLLEEKSK